MTDVPDGDILLLALNGQVADMDDDGKLSITLTLSGGPLVTGTLIPARTWFAEVAEQINGLPSAKTVADTLSFVSRQAAPGNARRHP